MDQLLDVLSHISSSSGKCTFEQVRAFLYKIAKRKAPPSREVMWTVARDVLTDLQRLGFLKTGMVPRKRSEVNRLRETPCEITPAGSELARLYKEKRGEAFNKLLFAWMNGHAYFRQLTIRLLRAPMFIPDITGIKQLGKDLPFPIEPTVLARQIRESCSARLAKVDFSPEKAVIFNTNVEQRVTLLASTISLTNLDAKKLVDTIEDNVVVPALLEAENLRFDSITLQHLVGCARDLYSASATSSHPSFVGRVLFSTCDFVPDLVSDPNADVTGVIHHGRASVSNLFTDSIVSSYKQLAGASFGYVDIYSLRALVCISLRIQPTVFTPCLERLMDSNLNAGIKIYTELPFTPPPRGEDYVEIRNRRIGSIKLSSLEGG